MANINSAEILARRYGPALGSEPVEKATRLLEYMGLAPLQPKTGVMGDIEIGADGVMRALDELIDSSQFQEFALSLTIARLAEIDTSSKVLKTVLKVEKAIAKLRRPDISKIIADNLQEMKDNDNNPEFVVTTFE